MELVQALQIITIVVSVLSLAANAAITVISNKRNNYNAIITENRLEFMKTNRKNAAEFVAEVRSIAFLFERGEKAVELKAAYRAFSELKLFLKAYNSFDKEIIDEGEKILSLAEELVSGGSSVCELKTHLQSFERLMSVYDDADWRFIKQQYNGTKKTSDDFDKICDDIKAKYNSPTDLEL